MATIAGFGPLGSAPLGAGPLGGTAPVAAGVFTLTAESGSYVLTGIDAAVLHRWKLDATTAGSYALTGTDVTLTKSSVTNKVLVADAGSYLLAGSDVSLAAGSNNKVIVAGPGTYLLTGTDVSFIPVPPSAFPTRGEWPEKARKKRRQREDARAESVQAARAARDALRASLSRLYDGEEYDAPALEEAEAEALATVNALNRLPYLPIQELQVAEELIRSIQELVRQRLLDEAQTDAAVQIAAQHLNDTIAIAEQLYRKTRFNYLATAALMMAE